MQEVLDILEQFSKLHVWVIGDLILDTYSNGTIDRISPEAPVQVVNIENDSSCLGGAANVARQLAALGVKTVLGGYIGKDEAGRFIENLSLDAGICTTGILHVSNRPSVQKTRVIARGQQIIRLDKECRIPLEAVQSLEILGRLELWGRPDIIILSDYLKGTVTPYLSRTLTWKAREWGVPIVVDSKSSVIGHFKGVVGLTPNLGEAERCSGTKIDVNDDESLSHSSRIIGRQTKSEWVLITLGDQGMSLWESEGNKLTRIPPEICHARDVTGAGDTVVAFLAASIAAKVPVFTGAKLANLAASITVSKLGTYAVSPEEILAKFSAQDIQHKKVIPFNEIDYHARLWKAANKKIVFTNGCFDILHIGHLSLLRRAKELGDILVVGLNSDESIRSLNKGPERPLISEQERAQVLAALECIDAVVIFNEPTPLQLIQQIIPHVLVKGKDYEGQEVVGEDITTQNGGSVVLLDLIPDKSTTSIVNRILGRQ